MESHVLTKDDWIDIYALRDAKKESLPIDSVQEITLNNKLQLGSRWYEVPSILNLGRVHLGEMDSIKPVQNMVLVSNNELVLD